MIICPPFSFPHIIYLVLSALFILFGCICMKSNKISKIAKRVIIKISAVIVIIAVIIKQIEVTKKHFLLGESNYLVYLLPNSFCSFSAFFLALSALVGKKDSNVFHFLCYTTLIGCLPSIIFPDYLYHQAFFELGTMASLTFHVLAVWISLALFFTNDFIPNFKKFWFYPIGFIIMIAFGAIQVYILGSNDAMNITKPLISGWNFTYWYFLFPVFCGFTLLLIWLYSKFIHNSKN